MVGKMAKRDYFHSLGKSTESPIKPDWLSNQSVLNFARNFSWRDLGYSPPLHRVIVTLVGLIMTSARVRNEYVVNRGVVTALEPVRAEQVRLPE